MESVYYSPREYWRGRAASGKLAEAENVSRSVPANWLARQAIWKIYLPPANTIQYAHFDFNTLNEIHQAYIFLPHDTIKKVDVSHTCTNTH